MQTGQIIAGRAGRYVLPQSLQAHHYPAWACNHSASRFGKIIMPTSRDYRHHLWELSVCNISHHTHPQGCSPEQVTHDLRHHDTTKTHLPSWASRTRSRERSTPTLRQLRKYPSYSSSTTARIRMFNLGICTQIGLGIIHACRHIRV